MTLRSPVAALALLATASFFPFAARAECRTEGTGARCIQVLQSAAVESLPTSGQEVMSSGSAPSAPIHVGDVLPRGEFSIILNADYYGLPPVSDGWVYMRVGGDAYRVDWRTHEVLERVTERTAANF